MATKKNNYTVGKGEIHFALFKEGTQDPDGYRYLGNTPEFSMTIETENLDHFNADRGIKEKDESVPISVTRSGQLTTDNVVPENLALFFFGSTSVEETDDGAVTGEEIDGVKQGYSYQLGLAEDNYVGNRGISEMGVTVQDDEMMPNTFTIEEDYTIDYDRGVISIVEGGDIADGTNLVVAYTVEAKSFKRVISGSTPVEGAMVFRTYNPVGEQMDYFMPWVKLAPNGDFALKSEEWQTIPLNVEILKPTGKEAILINGVPFDPTP